MSSSGTGSDTVIPTETVTFLYTDVEESTRAWSRYPSLARDAQVAIDRIIRTRVADSGGVVFRSTGDGLCAVFKDVDPAVLCATGVQQDLDVEGAAPIPNMRVRIALATGVVTRTEYEYAGLCAHLVARLLDLCHGGQVVCCEETARRFSGSNLEGIALKSLGRHFLKGFESAQLVEQVCHPALRNDFPPPRSIKSAWTNVAVELNRFIGRSREIGRIAQAFENWRIVTLVGPGGVGKTRLAQHWALRQRDFDGVWMVDLASLTETTLVAQSIARTLGIAEEPNAPTIQSLCKELRRWRTLLILDNCEHLLLGCAAVAERLARECPEVRILATSREALGIDGEAIVRLSPLPVAAKQKPGARPEAESDASRLFLERAGAFTPENAVSEMDAASVAEVCRLVDGIPLGIELAAARMRSMSIEQLLRRLTSSHSILDADSRGSARRRSIRSTVRWSFELLSRQELILLRRLSVFAGGFTVTAAEAVVADAALAKDHVFELLASLVDKSLIALSDTGASPRYSMLESIREQAYEDLSAAGETVAILTQHARWAVRFAEDVETGLTQNLIEQVSAFEGELPNFRAVMGRSLSAVDSEYGIRIGSALYKYWSSRGSFKEAVDWLTRLLDVPNSMLDSQIISFAYTALGGLARAQGDYSLSTSAFERVLDEARRRGEMDRVADCLNNLGLVCADRGDVNSAFALLKEALRFHQKSNDRTGMSACLLNLGYVSLSAGLPAEAALNFQRCLELDRETTHEWGVAASLEGLGRARVEMGDLGEGRQALLESLRIRRRVSDRPGLIESLEALAVALSVAGAADIAAQMLGAAMSERAQIDASCPWYALGAFESAIKRVVAQLGRDAAERNMELGAALGAEGCVDRLLESYNKDS